MSHIYNSNSSIIPWNIASKKCQRELVIKKIGIILIALANLALLAALFTYLTMRVPISASPLLASPFVVGGLGALSYLKIPTLGLSHKNYKEYSNPAILLARAVTFVFFAPVVGLSKWLDWTAYGDPYVSKRIADDFKEKTFEEILPHYGPLASNLYRYGYLSKKNSNQLKMLHLEAKHHIETKKFLIEEKASETDLLSTNTALSQISQKWTSLKELIIPTLPSPHPSVPDFQKTSTKVKIWFRKFFGIYTLN